MNIAVLMTCHNRKKTTINCLESLFSQNFLNNITLKVFLVDDGSTDGTSQAIKEKFPQVNIIQGNGNLFWNRGMHMAWEKAINDDLNYDFFLWLNDDVLIKENGLLNLINDALNNNDAIICGVMESKIDKGTITYGGRHLNEVLIQPTEFPTPCELINGNMVLIPSLIVNDIGILNSFYIHAIGDYEYGLRAIKSGYKCFISSFTVGFCEKNSSLPDWCSGKINIINRLKSLYSPLGNSHPYYYFFFKFKYFGLLSALRVLTLIHIRLILPNLWKN